jgi:hypothetical protein
VWFFLYGYMDGYGKKIKKWGVKKRGDKKKE